MSEGRQQLLIGAGLAAVLGVLFFVKPDMPRLFGIAPQDMATAIFGGLAALLIAWKCASPPEGRDAWFVAANALFLTLLLALRLKNAPPVVMEFGIAAAVVMAGGGLFMLKRAMRGAR